MFHLMMEAPWISDKVSQDVGLTLSTYELVQPSINP